MYDFSIRVGTKMVGSNRHLGMSVSTARRRFTFPKLYPIIDSAKQWSLNIAFDAAGPITNNVPYLLLEPVYILRDLCVRLYDTLVAKVSTTGVNIGIQ